MTAADHTLPARRCLEQILAGYGGFRRWFDRITDRAGRRFAQRDWEAMRADTVERLDLYEQSVKDTRDAIETVLGPAARNKALWEAVKQLYAEHCDGLPDNDIRRTFYNSVNRRIFNTFGIDPQTEFAGLPRTEDQHNDDGDLARIFPFDRIAPESVRSILDGYDLGRPFSDPDRDAALCAQKLADRLGRRDSEEPRRIEMIKAPFYRDTRAYLIGRVHAGSEIIPVVFAVGNTAHGLVVDALLLTDEQIRVLFSFTRAYFHVAVEKPAKLVNFLKTVMPTKRKAELYIVLGFHKHGKTVLYQDLLHHQQVCGLDRFETAAGQRGMVMIAFNMPQDELIYKLIRDRFASPKQTTRQQVMEKYDYVFKHDRAGRLVDVQTFENLKIEKCCFTDELLSEIDREARKTASIQNGQVLLHHVYVERRVTPLDLFLKSADPASAEKVVIDYGQAIKDLARVNVFPGDMLLKNFGVTRLGRVVFYDYDELCPLTLCRFRILPEARHYDDLLEAEPWFMVDEHDVFPEELSAFLGFSPEQKHIFLKHHGDLLTPAFWQQTQEQIKKGEWEPILPYTDSQRLENAAGMKR